MVTDTPNITTAQLLTRAFAPQSEGGHGADVFSITEWHNDYGPDQFVSRNIDLLKHKDSVVLLELPPVLNPMFQLHLQGKMSDEELRSAIADDYKNERNFVRIMEKTDMAINLQKKGVPVFGIDSRYSEQIAEIQPRVKNASPRMQEGWRDAGMDAVLQTIKKGEELKIPYDVITAELAHHYMQGHATAVIIYGRDHMDGGSNCRDEAGQLKLMGKDIALGVLNDALAAKGHTVFSMDLNASQLSKRAEGASKTAIYLLSGISSSSSKACTAHIPDARGVLVSGSDEMQIYLTEEQRTAGKAALFAGTTTNYDYSSEPASPKTTPTARQLIGDKLDGLKTPNR